MAWARIDDKFLDNPKVRKAGKEATYLYLSGLVYSSSQLTEGFISDEALGLVAFKGFIRNEQTHADKLVECGLWDRVDGGYQIHDYLEYNPTKEEIEQARAKRSTAGSVGAQARWQNDSKPHAKPIANAMRIACDTDAIPMRSSCDSDGISPSHPIPIPNPLKEQEAAAAVSESFPANPALSAYERNIGVATPGTLALINAAVKDYPAGWVEDAIREAAGNNARSWNYIAKILERWKVEGRAPKNGHKQPGADVEHFRKLYCEQKRGAA